jgi:hypothetical protein
MDTKYLQITNSKRNPQPSDVNWIGVGPGCFFKTLSRML